MIRVNFCESRECSKICSNTPLFCSKCYKKFCSNNCIIKHVRDHHNPNTTLANKQTASNETKKEETTEGGNVEYDGTSIYLKPGKYLMEIVLEDIYHINNYDLKLNQALGVGSFGEVYVGVNKKDKKKYAIKRIDKKKFQSNGTTKEQIQNEIDIQARVIHDHIVRLFSFHETDNYFYLISELASKGSLYSYIRKCRGMDEKLGFHYFIQTASAIQFLHSIDLVHRDLKPENILIDENNNVKLCDFGWCVRLDQGPRSTFCGTYEYMAPEVVKEEPYSKSIDVWSLGVLLYEILHGYSPFRAKNSRGAEMHKEIFSNITKYKYKIDKILTASCKDLINKLLLPDKNKRMTIEDVFKHPWVVKNESEMRKVVDKPSVKTKFVSSNTLTSFSSNLLGEKEVNELGAEANPVLSSLKANNIVINTIVEEKAEKEKESVNKQTKKDDDDIVIDLDYSRKKKSSQTEQPCEVPQKKKELKETISKAVKTESNKEGLPTTTIKKSTTIVEENQEHNSNAKMKIIRKYSTKENYHDMVNKIINFDKRGFNLARKAMDKKSIDEVFFNDLGNEINEFEAKNLLVFSPNLNAKDSQECLTTNSNKQTNQKEMEKLELNEKKTKEDVVSRDERKKASVKEKSAKNITNKEKDVKETNKSNDEISCEQADKFSKIVKESKDKEKVKITKGSENQEKQERKEKESEKEKEKASSKKLKNVVIKLPLDQVNTQECISTEVNLPEKSERSSKIDDMIEKHLKYSSKFRNSGVNLETDEDLKVDTQNLNKSQFTKGQSIAKPSKTDDLTKMNIIISQNLETGEVFNVDADCDIKLKSKAKSKEINNSNINKPRVIPKTTEKNRSELVRSQKESSSTSITASEPYKTCKLPTETSSNEIKRTYSKIESSTLPNFHTDIISNIISNNLEKKIDLVSIKKRKDSSESEDEKKNQVDDLTYTKTLEITKDLNLNKDNSISNSILDLVLNKVKAKKSEKKVVLEDYMEQGMEKSDFNSSNGLRKAKTSIKREVLSSDLKSSPNKGEDKSSYESSSKSSVSPDGKRSHNSKGSQNNSPYKSDKVEYSDSNLAKSKFYINKQKSGSLSEQKKEYLYDNGELKQENDMLVKKKKSNEYFKGEILGDKQYEHDEKVSVKSNTHTTSNTKDHTYNNYPSKKLFEDENLGVKPEYKIKSNDIERKKRSYSTKELAELKFKEEKPETLKHLKKGSLTNLAKIDTVYELDDLGNEEEKEIVLEDVSRKKLKKEEDGIITKFFNYFNPFKKCE